MRRSYVLILSTTMHVEASEIIYNKISMLNQNLTLPLLILII